MTKREPLMTENYFLNQLNVINEEVEYSKGVISSPPPTAKLELASFNLYNQLYKQLEAACSVGSQISGLLPLLLEIVDALTYCRERTPSKEKLFFVGEADEYMSALTLISWGLTLDVPTNVFNQLVAVIDKDGQQDALLDLLIRTRQPSRQQSTTLAFAKQYQPLYEAATRVPIDVIGIASFLKRWYETCLRQTSTYNLHRKHGGNDSGFTGYWAWEVAGLTYALGLDDITYRNLPYYPADLVAYTRHR